MTVLVTNDDGVNAPGLRALVNSLSALGRVVVAAPDRERSAASHSLTLNHPLRVHELDRDTFAVDGTPTDCIHLAVHVILKGKPDLLAAGINRGSNLGDDVTYSGTVWAALEGRMMGIPSFAVSLAYGDRGNYGPAAGFAALAASWIVRNPLPPDTILNINVPDKPDVDLRRFVVTRQGRRRFRESVVEKQDPRGRSYFWIGGEPLPPEGGIETDVGAVGEGLISVTPLHADMTNHGAIAGLVDLGMMGRT